MDALEKKIDQATLRVIKRMGHKPEAYGIGISMGIGKAKRPGGPPGDGIPRSGKALIIWQTLREMGSAVSVRELADFMGIEPKHISSYVANWEKKGHLVRIPGTPIRYRFSP